METLPRDRRVRLRSALQLHQFPQAPSQAPEATVNDFITCSPCHTDIGREEFGKGMTAFWRKIVDEPDPFLPEFGQLFVQSSLTVLGGKCQPDWVGMAWRRLITAGAMRQWRPRLEGNQEVRQFGVAAPGGVEHVGLRARTRHETGHWLIRTYCSNAFNTVKRTALLVEEANYVPARTPFVAKCYGIQTL